MLTNLLLALLTCVALLIIDWAHAGKSFSIADTWQKYVFCLGAGLLYNYITLIPFFKYLAIIGVIYIISNSFSAIWTWIAAAIAWVKANAKKL